MEFRKAGEKVMRFYFSGETGKHFHIDDKLKIKIKKDIINYIKKYRPIPERYIFEFRAVDGFSLLALEAVMSFVKTHSIQCSFRFRSVLAGDFAALPQDVQETYESAIWELTDIGIPVRDDTAGSPLFDYYDKNDIARVKLNYKCDTDGGPGHVLISYFEENTKDKWIKYEYIPTRTSDNITHINLFDCYNSSHGYIHSSYSGVRKQKNSSKYYYRIKIKLPDGSPVNIEKGSFFTAEEADKARRKHLILLTTQDCNEADKTVDEVFNEFISIVCRDKDSLEKKYLSYYNSHVKGVVGKVKIWNAKDYLYQLYKFLQTNNVTDNRTKDKKGMLSKDYVSGLRAMLCNLFDYAYNMKYIKSHPMYALPSKWGVDSKGKNASKKEKNNFIQPLFAYLGNKHRLLPDIKRLFPKDFDVFVDLFGGSGVVGINSDARQIIINDSNLFLIGIYKGIQETTPDTAWRLIETIINQYSLNQENENGYYICRDEYNKIPYKERCENYWYWGLVLVWCSFNRSTVQFNLQNEYNAPFGFNKVNFELAKQKFFAFAKKVSGGKIAFSCADYKNVDIPTGTFVYIDPPYLITTATYNKAWDEQSESELYTYLEELDNKGVKWAMSNVFENNGEKHTMLSDLINRKRYKVHYLESEYIHANFRRKNKGRTVEVLITNY